jgi:hypothetical protein
MQVCVLTAVLGFRGSCSTQHQGLHGDQKEAIQPVPIVKKIYNLWQELVKRGLNMSPRTFDDSFAVMSKAKIATFF